MLLLLLATVVVLGVGEEELATALIGDGECLPMLVGVVRTNDCCCGDGVVMDGDDDSDDASE